MPQTLLQTSGTSTEMPAEEPLWPSKKKVRRGLLVNPSSHFLILLDVAEHVLIGIGILHVGDGESNNDDLVVGVFHIK